MEEPSFSGLLVVVAVAFAAPFLLGLAPRLRLPSVIFEIVAGIVIGPSVPGGPVGRRHRHGRHRASASPPSTLRINRFGPATGKPPARA